MMRGYAEEMDFEKAIECRERIRKIRTEIERKNEG